MSYGRPIILVALVTLAILATSVAAQQPNPQLVAGINAIDAADYEQAVTSLQQAVEAQPDSEAAQFHLGVAYFYLQQYPEALAAFRKAEQLAPARPGVRLYIGHIYAAQGALEEAIAAYRQELFKLEGPQKTEALVALGRTLARAGQLDQAQETLSQAVYYDPKCVEAYYHLGWVYLQLGQPQQALEQFQQADEILQAWNDMNVRLQRLPVSEQRRQETTEETMAQQYSRAELFARELGLWPELSKAIGDTYAALGEWTNARNAYRQALNRSKLGNPSDPDVYVRVGRALLEDVKKMFYDEGLLYSAIPMTNNAIEAAEKALQLSPDYPPAHELLGEVYALQANTYASDPDRNIVSHSYEEAIEEFEKALELNPSSVRALTELARTYLDQANKLEPGSAAVVNAARQAMSAAERGLELDPQNVDLYIQLARAELLRENHAAALETAQYALRLKPTDVAGLNTAGLAAYYQNDLTNAVKYFTEAIRNKPDHAQSHVNLGNAFFQMGSWYRARRQYNKALEYIPQAQLAKTAYQRAYICYMIALSYHETANYEQEIVALNQALSLDPNYFAAYRQMGRAYLARREYRAARRVLEIAIQNASTDEQIADVHVQIGEVLETQGNVHEAITAYSAALAADPANALASSALVRLSHI